MRTIEEQHKLLEDLLEIARQRKSAGETEWTTGQKAEYTRNKGFDDNYYKDLILKALDQHITLSRPEIDNLLMTKLPEALTDKQKLYKIGNLLAALRSSGKIVFGEKKLWRRK